MKHKQLFWLHIKKSAGITTRNLLQPYYIEVDRSRNPKNFIQATPEEYNDILNNYRVVLGEYQFKRCLFAKKYLYPDSWDNLFSFAFSREPIDRCISMFFYLYRKENTYLNYLKGIFRGNPSIRKFYGNTAYAFDVFLELVQESQESNSVYSPRGIHFSTHTAPMWNDITDDEGNILLSSVFRLENLHYGINRAFKECGIEKRQSESSTILNRNKKRKSYTPTKYQRNKIKAIYRHDFELYENAK